jgi:LmbE family N-acetylglucosaminyl deacetylase
MARMMMGTDKVVADAEQVDRHMAETEVLCEAIYERWTRQALSATLLALQRWRRRSFDHLAGLDAWVVAPHPDDEVLGCGGTILLKRQLGAEVRIVFLTDGSASHGNAVDRAKLGERRRGEALKACRVLDISLENVFFLGLPDGNLAGNVREAAERLSGLFGQAGLTQFFVPHELERPQDHKAARAAALAAIRGLRAPAWVVEYPVWCWDRWPWVFPVAHGSWWRRATRRGTDLLRTLQWLAGCRACVNVASVVEQKRLALLEHASQALGLPEVPSGPTLLGLSHGELVARMMGPYEIFRVSRLGADA